MNDIRIASLIYRIKQSSSVNPQALAFILTELRFRGRFVRTCELIASIWILFVCRREPTLTIGKCQVAFSYWRARFGERTLPLLFAAATSDLTSYQVCCDYLLEKSGDDLKATLINYTGCPSRLYGNLFYKNLAHVLDLIERSKLRSDNACGNSSNVAPELRTVAHKKG